MIKNKILHGKSEEDLRKTLARITPSELVAAGAAIRVLSYDSFTQKLLSFDGSVDTLDIIDRAHKTQKDIRVLNEAAVKSSPYVCDHRQNGIWLSCHADGMEEIFLGPRDSLHGLNSGDCPSRFISDVCACLGIGIINCDFFYPARDMYLASALNSFDSDGMFIFYIQRERKGSVLRPFAAAKGARDPDAFGYKSPSEDTIKQKEDRHRAMFDKAVDHAVKTLNEDAEDDCAKDLYARRDGLYRHLRGQEPDYDGLVSAIYVHPSRLMVMSVFEQTNKGNYLFLLLDPWKIDVNILSDKGSKSRYASDIPYDKLGGRVVSEAKKHGFLLDITNDGERYILVPAPGFANALCHRLGCGKITFTSGPMGGNAGCAYLASLLSIAEDNPIGISVLRQKTGRRYSLCRALKICAPGNMQTQTPSEVVSHVSRYMAAKGFSLCAWRVDNDIDVTVDYVLCDGRGIPVRVPDIDYDVTVGVELQMSEGNGSAYRLCGVFYYKGSVIYCGASTDKMRKKCGSTAVYSKRKTASPMILSNLLGGFFTGSVRSDSGRKTSFRAPYDYLMEQAGLLLDDRKRSPRIGDSPRGGHTESVFHALSLLPVSDISGQLREFAENDYEPECAISRRVGKKRILLAAEENSGSGTMLDAVLALCALMDESSIPHGINFRHEFMTSFGTYLGIHGYRRS